MQADLCITRAGASSLAELSVLSIPFIAVPLPSARDDHQSANANFYKDKDCCWILEQSVFEEKIEVQAEEEKPLVLTEEIKEEPKKTKSKNDQNFNG